MASFFGRMLWSSGEQRIAQEDGVVAPNAPPAPEARKPKADIAMNCIRYYIVNRNRRIRELIVFLKDRIEQELRDQTLSFGRSEINMNIETIVQTSENFADDFDNDNNIVESEWVNIQKELSKHFIALGLKYKVDDSNVHICITIPIRPVVEASSEEFSALLSALWNNLMTYSTTRERDVNEYSNDLTNYIFEQICHVARTRGDNDIIIDLDNVYTLMPKWEKRWTESHYLLHTEQKKITAHLRQTMSDEGFDVHEFPWKFKISFTWNAPSCVWRYSDDDGAWMKM